MRNTSVNESQEFTLRFFLVIEYAIRDIYDLNSYLLLMISEILGSLNLEIFHENGRMTVFTSVINNEHKDLILNMSEVYSDQIADAILFINLFISNLY